MPADFDLAIAGSGFAGSLLAMTARRLGRSVILLERARHPRFAIGESSTPLANQVWEEIARAYDLDHLSPLAKWGAWQRHFPNLPVGLKRGFTFYHHEPGRAFGEDPDHRRQLLVAASSRDERADTHWYRSAFDQFLAHEAQRLGAEFVDGVQLDAARFEGDSAVVSGEHDRRPFHCRARFIVDATGSRGFLARALRLEDRPWTHLPPTSGLYTHFTGVRRWDELHPDAECPPYPVDDAALHHVFPGGWIWVLRFNNGVTSAGVAATHGLARELGLEAGRPAWDRLLARFPSVGEQFTDSEPVQPFVHAPSLSYHCGRVAGPRWALMPHAAGFLDPLLSTGIALSLFGVRRLARLFEEDWQRPRFDDHLVTYATQTDAELSRTELLIAALYANLGDRSRFRDLAMLYFAGVGYAEIARRLQRPDLAGDRFLLGDHPTFGPGLEACAREALRSQAQSANPPAHPGLLHRMIRETIAPIDVTGLLREDRRNWFPVDPTDLLESAAKLNLTAEEIQARLGLEPGLREIEFSR